MKTYSNNVIKIPKLLVQKIRKISLLIQFSDLISVPSKINYLITLM